MTSPITQDILTQELVLAAQNRVRAFFAQRRKPGQVPVDEWRFDLIRQIVGRYDTLATPRVDRDVDDLRRQAKDEETTVEAVLNAHLDLLCKDLEHHFGMLCEPGNRLLFTRDPQAYLVRKHFTLKIFVWCRVCLVEPKEPPQPVGDPMPLIQQLRTAMATLTDDTRREVLALVREGFCQHCGAMRPNCPCMRDE